MALPACDINVRGDGSDSNGGGFVVGGSGTDYSLQAAAEATWTNLYSESATTTLTDASSTGQFPADCADNIIYISAGTDFIAGWYRIVSRTDANNVELDRECASASSATDGVGSLGGAFATPGMAGKFADDNAVAGHRIHVKSGTPYAAQTASVNATGGIAIDLTNNMVGLGCFIEGYETTYGDGGAKPYLDCNGYAPAAVITLDGGSSDDSQTVANLEIDGDDQNTIGIDGDYNGYDKAIRCDVHNCGGSYGVLDLIIVGCKLYSNVIGASNCKVANCWIFLNSSHGLHNCTDVSNCTVSHNTDVGVSNLQYTKLVNCTVYGNGDSGITCVGTYRTCLIEDCIIANNGGYGLEYANQAVMNNVATWGNASGRTDTTPYWDANSLELANDATPFLDADPADKSTADFRLDPADSNYASLAGQAAGIPGQTNHRDIGAVQHADPSGGGGQLVGPSALVSA